MSDLTKILAENQKEMLKLITPMTKRSSDHRTLEDSDSEPENTTVAHTSSPVKTKATTSKTTPMNSRNKYHQKMEQNTTHRLFFKPVTVSSPNNKKLIIYFLVFKSMGLLWPIESCGDIPKCKSSEV